MKRKKTTKHHDLIAKPLAQAVALACASLGAHSVQAATACSSPISGAASPQCTLGNNLSLVINNTASISGNTYAISVTGTTSNSVSNSGVLIGKSGSYFTNAGIVVRGGADLAGGLTNSGTIKGTKDFYAAGVFLSNTAAISGSISNQAGGVIYGQGSKSAFGVSLTTKSSISSGITNSGFIGGNNTSGSHLSKSYARGISIAAGSSLSGGITNNSGGVIVGGNNTKLSQGTYANTGIGIYARGVFNGGVSNAGQIIGNGKKNAAGIQLNTGSAAGTTSKGLKLTNLVLTGDISNSGTIKATAPGFAEGINLANASMIGSIKNSGHITGAQIGSGPGYGIGINLIGATIAGSISNSGGVIAGHGGKGYFTGGTGIRVQYSTITGDIVNSGSIIGKSSTGVNYGIQLKSGTINGAITNNTGGLIAGSSGRYSAYGIALKTGSKVLGGITNSGTIRGQCATGGGSCANGYSSRGGILLYGSTLSGGITNHGVIEGLALTHSGAGVHLEYATLNGGINNDGTIIGNISSNGSYTDVADGIYANNTTTISGSITNNSGGKIIGGNNAALTATVSADQGYGIRIDGGSVTGNIANAGQVYGYGHYDGQGIDLANGTGTGSTSGGTLSNVVLTGNITNSGTIQGVGRLGTGLKVGNASVIGGINNSGSIIGIGRTFIANGVYISNARLTGTLTNNAGGLIFGSGTQYAHGIAISRSVVGGIDNSGNILACAGATAGGCTAAAANSVWGIMIDASSMITGSVTNRSGGLIQGDGNSNGYGILLTNSTINGAIDNAGLITGNRNAIRLRNAQVLGGIVNSTGGSILHGNTAIYIASTSLVTGGISNAGVINGIGGAGKGIELYGGRAHSSGSGTTLTAYTNQSLAGGIQNSGSIKGTATGSYAFGAAGINLYQTSVTGGITNNSGGLIQGQANASGGGATVVAGIAITASTLAGGISNSGTIQGLWDFNTVRGIYIKSSTLSGGVVNNASGVIRGAIGPSGALTQHYSHHNTGLSVQASALTGGISNAGAILGCRGTTAACSGAAVAPTGIGINIQSSTVAGGVTNQSGGLVEGSGIKRGRGINFSNSTIDGGIANSGTIKGFKTQPPTGYTAFPAVGILIQNHSLLASGGIVNNSGGMILGSGVSNNYGTALVVRSSLVKGGVSNAGTIQGTGNYQASGINIDEGISASTGSGSTATAYTKLALTGGIQNTGTILGKVAGSNGQAAGIEIYSATITGGISNGAGGLIQGQGHTAQGIYLSSNNTNLVGGISNAGTIRASGNYVYGIADYAQMIQGDIINSGTIRTCNAGGTGGCTASSAQGIYIYGGTLTGSVNNQSGGLISVAGVNNAQGVMLNNAKVQGAIINSGTIKARLNNNPSSDGLGISVKGSYVVGTGIQNNTGGQITGMGKSAGGGGILLSNSLVNGGISNAGIIQGISSSQAGIGINIEYGVGSTIGSGTTAVHYNHLAVTGGIQNSGTIKGSGSRAGNAGITVNSATITGGISNNSGGVIQAHNGIALNLERFTNLVGDIVNSGTIQATGNYNSNAGIYVRTAATISGGITNNTGGVIQASGTNGNQYGIRIFGATLGGGIVNSGTIQGLARTNCNSGSSCKGYGIYISGANISGGITNNSGGVIGYTGTPDSSGDDGYGIYIDSTSTPMVITNNTGGTISSIYFGGGSLVLTGDGATGKVTGTYQSNLSIRNSFTSGGDISGFGAVTVEDAATFNLNNNLSVNNGAGPITVGQGSSGVLNQSAGTLTATSLTVNAGGTYTQSGTGVLDVASTTLGAGTTLTLMNQGTGTIDGAADGQGNLVFAGNYNTDSALGGIHALNTITIDDGVTLTLDQNATATTFIVGQGTSGVLNFTAGTLTTTNFIISDNATYILSGTGVLNAVNTTIGKNAILSLSAQTPGNINGSGANTGSLIFTGNYNTAAPIGNTNPLSLIQVDDGVTLTLDQNATANTVIVGQGSSGIVNQSAGTLSVTNLKVNNGGTYTQSGSGKLAASFTTLGNGATLTLVNQGTGAIDGASAGQGNLVFAGDYNTDKALGGISALNAITIDDNATLTLDQNATATNFTIGQGSSGTVNQSAGTLSVGTASLKSGAVYNLTAGSINATRLSLASTLNQSGGTVTAGTADLASGGVYNLTGGGLNATSLNLGGTFNMSGGSLTAGTTIANLGFFIAQAGINHIGNLQVNSGGTLDVKNNNVTVTGNFTLAAGGILATTVNSGAQNDAGSLVVTGNANVSSGAVIDVTVAPNAVLSENTTYTILKAGGGNLNVPTTVLDNSVDFLFKPSIVGSDLILTTEYDNAAKALLHQFGVGINTISPNARSVLSALIAMIDVTTDKADLNNALHHIKNVGGFNHVLESLAPDLSAQVREASVLFGRSVVINILNRLTAARSGYADMTGLAAGDQFNNVTAWAQGFGTVAGQDNRNRVHGFDLDNKGLTLGLDSLVNDNLRLGVAFSYAGTRVDTKGLSDTTSIDSYQGSIYGSLDTPHWYLDGSLSYSWNDTRSRRHIMFGGLNRTASGAYGSNQVMLQGVLGKDYAMGNNVIVNPYLGLEYTNLSTDNYTETGAGSLDLSVNPSGTDSLTSNLGISIRKSFKTSNDTVIIPEAHIGWRYEFLHDDMYSTSTFAGGGTAFHTQGLTPGASGVNLGGTVSIYSSNKSEFQLKYDFEASKGYTAHSGNLIFRYLF